MLPRSAHTKCSQEAAAGAFGSGAALLAPQHHCVLQLPNSSVVTSSGLVSRKEHRCSMSIRRPGVPTSTAVLPPCFRASTAAKGSLRHPTCLRARQFSPS